MCSKSILSVFKILFLSSAFETLIVCLSASPLNSSYLKFVEFLGCFYSCL